MPHDTKCATLVPMKLFFDARYTRTDYHDGISRYSAELGNALLATNDVKNGSIQVTFLVCSEQQKQWFPKTASFLMIHQPTSPKEPFTAFLLNKYHPDVVYSPMQTIGTLGKKYKAVLTLHDMIYYRHNTPPKFLPWPIQAGWWLYHQVYFPQRLLLKGADLVTTVSETSKHDIIAAKMHTGPIPVIYNAPQQFSHYAVHHESPVKNLVFMGSFMAYKNVETLIAAMEWLPGRTLHLLSKIRPERRHSLTALAEVVRRKGGGEVIFHNGVSDDTYEQLLADNAILVSASLDEGYGIPVAEAMAMGVPVVASDIPVFHEVGGEGILYADPHHPQTFADAIKRYDVAVERDQYIATARAHIEQFNWNHSAATLVDALKSIMPSVTIDAHVNKKEAS